MNIIKKKFISVFAGLSAAVILLAALLTACGKDNTSPNTGGSKMDIVKDGGSAYTVLIPSGAEGAVATAAQELTDFIERTTGVRLAVADDGSFSGGKFISIGRTEKLKSSGIMFDYSKLNYDGFFIKAVGDNIYIDGDNGRGRLYGAYDFIERYLGVKFLTADVTHIPKLAGLSIDKPDIVQVPEFRQRNYYDNAVGRDPLFEARTRMYSDFSSDDARYGMESDWFKGTNTYHSSLQYVPQSEWMASHPEFYVEGNGAQRYDIDWTNGITDDDKIDESMEVSVFKIVLENLKKFAKQDENAKFFMIGMSDTLNAIPAHSRWTDSVERNGTNAGVVAVFMNNIAREIKKWSAAEYPQGREINVVMFAYLWMEEPPVVKTQDGKFVPKNQNVVLENNVHVRYAPINANVAFGLADMRQSTQQREYTLGWGAVTKNLMIWDYTTFYSQGYLWYYPSLHYLQDNLKLYKQLGATYVMSQSSFNTNGDWQNMLKTYISKKLYWNVNLSVKALIDEFIYYFHGEAAAKGVTEFLDTMELHAAEMRTINNYSISCVVPNQEYFKPQYFSTSLFNKCFKSLNGAADAIDQASNLSAEEKELYKSRLIYPMMIPQYMVLCDYGAYYSSGMIEMARGFYDNAQAVGFTMYNENNGLGAFMSKFGW